MTVELGLLAFRIAGENAGKFVDQRGAFEFEKLTLGVSDLLSPHPSSVQLIATNRRLVGEIANNRSEIPN